jgi:hypothetical protein
MTTQQLSRFRTVLMCLFNQATREPWPFASNVLLPPCYSRLAAVLLPPVTNAEDRFCTAFLWSPRRHQLGQALRPIPSDHPAPFNPHSPSTVRAA